MATTTPNFGWPVPTSTDLVKDGATAIEALGDSIDASLLDLKGGTSGQVLAKNSNTDMDFVWVAQDDSNAIQNTIVDAKGDLIAATAADTPARLAVGTNGQVLTADSTAATGLAWTTPASGSGLTLINSTTFTGSSTVSVNSVFSSTYRNYKMVISYTMSANNEPLYMRMRVSGTDNSSANYFINGTVGVTSSITNIGNANETAFKLQQGGATAAGITMDLYAPNIGTRINITSQGSAISTGAYASSYQIGGFLDANVTADGFTLIPGAGTITGIVKVYGYAN
jgi:hypothetical protein